MAQMDHRHRPHALAFPFPAQGHINPMLNLCRRLASLGFIITFVNTSSNHRRFFPGAGDDPAGSDEFRFVALADDRLPSEALRGNNLQLYLNALEEGLRGSFESLLQRLMEERLGRTAAVTCIISDATIWWPQAVAHRFGICRVSLWTPCTSFALICRNLEQLQEMHVIGKNRRADIEVLDLIPGSRVPVKALPSVLLEGDESFDPGFKRRKQRHGVLGNDAYVLCNTFYELQQQQLDRIRMDLPNFMPIGPLVSGNSGDSALRSSGLWEEDLSCLQWLDEQPVGSVLYISFGSIATFSLEQLQEIYKGLLMARQKFLWVIRADVVDKQDERSQLVMKIKEDSESGMVTSWAPQRQVLEHGSVAAFLTHCGWNSTMEAVAFGVPLLCWPCFGDQPMNAHSIVEDWKIGLFVRELDDVADSKRITSAGKIERVMRKIMGKEGEEIRRRVRFLSEQATRANAPGGSSYNNLHTFLLDMEARVRKF